MSDDTNKPVTGLADGEHLYGWSAQQGVAPQAPEAVPGNVVTVAELPYESSLKEQGINPAQYQAGLYIADGPDQKAAIKRERVADRVAEVKAVEDNKAKQDDVAAARLADVKNGVLPSDVKSGDANVSTNGTKNPSTDGTPGAQPPVGDTPQA